MPVFEVLLLPTFQGRFLVLANTLTEIEERLTDSKSFVLLAFEVEFL